MTVACVACVHVFVGVATVIKLKDIKHWSASSKAARTPRRLAQDAVVAKTHE